MTNFVDATGHRWPVTVDTSTIAECRKRVDVDLLDIEGDLFGKLIDPVTLVATLYVVCLDEVERLSLTERDFAKRIVGDVIDHATNALVEATFDFFPNQRRAVLKSAWEKVKQIQDETAKRAQGILENAPIEDVMRKTFAEAEKRLAELTNGGN